ncbi:MAG: threonine/serine exporter family protein, partial [Planctomycetota bacterium]
MVTILDHPMAKRPFPDALGAGESRESVAFLLRIGRALHRYGSPAHRLEACLTELAQRMNLVGQFFATPTSLFIALGKDDRQRTYLLRVEPGEVNLSKLADLDMIVDRFVQGELETSEANDEVERILNRAPRYGRIRTTIAHAFACGGAAIFFGGTWVDMGLAGLVGIILGLLWIAIEAHRRALRLFETLAGMIAASVAVICAWLIGEPVSPSVVTVAGIIVLVPGLTMTVAINELATRNLASGTARLMGGLTILIALGFGAAIGLRLESVLPARVPMESLVATPLFLEVPLVAASALAFVVLFQARLRDALSILLTCGLALYGARIGSAVLGPELGACFGAFVVGLTSNVIARVRKLPAVIAGLPGLIFLVPGSIGFQSFSALIDHVVSLNMPLLWLQMCYRHLP